jgi:hypothetical protein
MGRSHKERPPIKSSTLGPLISHDDQDQEEGRWPTVGHRDPLSNDEASANTGAGVEIGNQAPGTRRTGEGPGEGEDVAGGIPNAKP